MTEKPQALPDPLWTPPAFCQYAGGPCDQDFQGTRVRRAVILYPSEPLTIAATIENAASILNRANPGPHWDTWKQFQTTGQVVFCSICKAMRFSELVVADVTTLNFNLLFEIGFALGLNLRVAPIRDTTIIRDKREFEELGLLDTIGYLDFQNADGLAQALLEKLPAVPIPAPATVLNREAPLYVLKGPIETEGAVRLMSTLKKSALRFRTFDVLETPRLSLQEARKQTAASYGVVAHLLSPDRESAKVHNARCALVAGIGMATGKVVVLLQEGVAAQPIDYREVVLSYTKPDQIPKLLERPLRDVLTLFQDTTVHALKTPEGLLERLDLGDVAAENEIRGLRGYFVQTGQFNEAKRGHARLVVGRKGSGKTAIFYAVRESFWNRRSHLILDLKPEGHQFIRLRETVLSALSPGLQEYTLTAFWNYILLVEIALKITDREYVLAQRDHQLRPRFDRLLELYRNQAIDDSGDFSERLLGLIERMTARFATRGEIQLNGGELTELLFKGDIRSFDDAVGAYLEKKEEVWLLIDNLDKGWPTRGATREDILLLRSLLEATRKLQRQLEHRNVVFHCLVFLRNDIHDLLVSETPDKGKDTAIVVDWDDVEAFKKVLYNRITGTLERAASFSDAWSAIAEPHVGAQDSFSYILERTLMRPRDLLRFVRRCVEVAVNRGHGRLSADDIQKAEKSFSEDILLETQFELRDVHREHVDPLYEFLGCNVHLSKDEALMHARGDERLLEMLVWFGFLGVQESRQAEPRFSYEVRYNVTKLMAPAMQNKGVFVIHPAFRSALEAKP